MNRFKLLACLAFAAMALPARAAEPNLPPDLAAVPGNAIGFVHLRVADLWKNDALKQFRAMIEKAGPKALEAFDQRFVPAPSMIDRVTVFAIMPANPGPEPPFVGVVACNKPFDRAKLLKSLLPKGTEMTAGGTTFHADGEFELAIRVIDDHTFAVATPSTMRQYLEMPKATENLLAPVLREAAGKHHVVLGLNATILPNEVVTDLPPPLQPLARAKTIGVAIDLNKDLLLSVHAAFADEAQAKSGEKAAHDGLKMARAALAQAKIHFHQQVRGNDSKAPSAFEELPEAVLSMLALGGLETLDEFLKDLPIERDGKMLATSAKLPIGPYASILGVAGMSAGFALPAVRSARMAATRSRSANNLKQILIALHSYADTYRGFPPAAICDKNGKPLLSWRVAILPFIDQEPLFKQFHLDEPWDSEHNKKLLSQMPLIYGVTAATKLGDSMTHYRVFYGNGAAFELKKPVRFLDFTDGTSNTIMVVEAAEGVPWTRPDGFEYDPKKPLPKLGAISPEGFWVAMADGSVRFLSHTIKESTLRAAITRNGGEIVNLNE